MDGAGGRGHGRRRQLLLHEVEAALHRRRLQRSAKRRPSERNCATSAPGLRVTALEGRADAALPRSETRTCRCVYATHMYDCTGLPVAGTKTRATHRRRTKLRHMRESATMRFARPRAQAHTQPRLPCGCARSADAAACTAVALHRWALGVSAPPMPCRARGHSRRRSAHGRQRPTGTPARRRRAGCARGEALAAASLEQRATSRGHMAGLV